MTKNPNPRGWRRGDLFIDLGRVQCAYRAKETILYGQEEVQVVYVVFRSSGGERAGELSHGATPIGAMSDEAFQAFLTALEMYWSLL